MTQERLNNVMIVNGHKERTHALDFVAVAKDFTQTNDRPRFNLINGNTVPCGRAHT